MAIYAVCSPRSEAWRVQQPALHLTRALTYTHSARSLGIGIGYYSFNEPLKQWAEQEAARQQVEAHEQQEWRRQPRPPPG